MHYCRVHVSASSGRAIELNGDDCEPILPSKKQRHDNVMSTKANGNGNGIVASIKA